MFVLVAAEPAPEGAPTIRSLVEILRFPAAGQSIDQVADGIVSMFEDEGLQITGRSETAVGADRQQAVRIEAEGELPGAGTVRVVTYMIDDGAVRWMVAFTVDSAEYDAVAPTIVRGMASLTLASS